MTKRKIIWLVILVILWSSYGIWEYHVTQWAKTEQTPVIRVDLVLIIPILIAFTVFTLYKLFRK